MDSDRKKTRQPVPPPDADSTAAINNCLRCGACCEKGGPSLQQVNAILDAAAQGSYTVRRGPLTNTYRARLTLIGSMNPEEGNLRPQIMDRFGLRVVVSGLSDAEERREVARRVKA